MAEPGSRPAHWADAAAAEIQARGGTGEAVVCTGISPSGPFHVGHLREIITGDAVARAARERGLPARLVFVVDNLDPLRRVYPFLDRDAYEPLIGRPLCELPAPDGDGTYDEQFLAPFLEALGRLRVEVDVVRSSELYGSGRMNESVMTALESRDRIAAILEGVTGRAVAADWSPWNPLCPHCRRIDGGTVRGHDRGSCTIVSDCSSCGERSEQSPAGGGKLTWRVDWAARWSVLGVAAEPFGKDHASRGGSWDTGIRIAKEVFGIEPPHPVVYEWIALRGAGDMSSSRGNVLEVADLLAVVPPEVLRYLVLKTRPAKSIRFDPGLALLRLVDEVDDASAAGRDDRALELSRAAGFEPVGVPFHHLVLVAQLAEFDAGRAVEILARGGYERVDRSAVAGRIGMAREWLARFAPDDVRVEVPEEVPDAARSLDDDQRAFLERLADRLAALTEAVEIHAAIRELAVESGGPGAKRGFQAIYKALLGRDRGPRAGFFVATLGPERVARRLRDAAATRPAD